MGIYHPHNLGQKAENAARLFLEKKGLIFIENNFRTRLGEIDLIMQEQNCIVFVEVRSRSRLDYGSALESIQQNKVSKLLAAATLYLQKRGWLNRKDSRFDVIAIDASRQEMQIEWVKNAF